MTSAHRPTFVHAIAREKQSKAKIEHDRALPSHKKVKLRASASEKELKDKDSEFKHNSESNVEPDGDKILLEDPEDENSSEFSEESDSEDDLLKELELLKKTPDPKLIENETTRPISTTSTPQRVEKPSWRNKKRQRSIKSIKNTGNDLIKSDQHAKFMNKYIR